MILHRKSMMNLPEYESRTDNLTLKEMTVSEIGDMLKDFVQIQQLYHAAILEISAKLEILDNEFQLMYAHNPIHHIESRLKQPASIVNKLIRKGLNIDINSAKESIMDIAGIRVICNYIEDVYTIADLLSQQADVTLIKRKDYIKKPKPNGYRSLHIIVTVPVFLSHRTENVPVEIQIRTVAMDFWASLEHELNYKASSDVSPEIKKQLQDCANELARIELKMQSIHHTAQTQKTSKAKDS